MKKIISLILCVLMIVPLFAFSSTAANDGKSEEAYNFAPKGSAYATSQWNNDSDPRYINNGDTSDSYRYWRPNGHGRDPNMDDTEQHCGIRFQGGQYYEIQEVVIYNYMEGKSNDIKYVVEALVLGEWIVIGESRNYVPENEFTGEEIKGAKVGKLTKAQVKEIAEMKMPDLNAASLEAAMSMVAGTARSMGITVEE